jgi:hypothetical protein
VKCAGCGSLARPTRTMKTEAGVIAGVRFALEREVDVCPDCDAAYAPKDPEQLALVLARELARLGHRTGPAFRAMRRALKLGRAELAKLLDVAPATISRWEGEKLPVDARAFVVLGALVSDAAEGRDVMFRLLRAVAEPAEIGDQPVRVRVP